MNIDEALYQLKQNIKIHEIEGTTSNQNEREKVLLNYITNLQKIEQQYSVILSENAELENKITNLQEENKQLKKDFISQNNTIIDLHIELNQRQYRINKAVELINNHQLSNFKELEYISYREFKKDLENILKGSDDNE